MKYLNEKSIRATRRHYDHKWKSKKHPSAKCSKAKCMVCHTDKVMNMPDRQTMRANSI